jgi:hypothetical protein
MNRKKILQVLLLISILTLCSSAPYFVTYDSNFVEISGVTDKRGVTYNVVTMNRTGSGNRIKAKYFAAKDNYGTTVPFRVFEWAKGKNLIAITSAGYMDNSITPVGLTIDNGRIVNRNLENFDALIIVYATGGIAATNLDLADLKLQGGGIDPTRKFDIRNNSRDREEFIDWAENVGATVFQTHLLVYKDVLAITPSAPSATKDIRERRFLAVGTDKNTGDIIHVIINSSEYTSLYEGSRRTKDFLNEYKDMNVIFMINLDTGAQDVFNLYNKDGSINKSIKGEKSMDYAANLLCYYFE